MGELPTYKLLGFQVKYSEKHYNIRYTYSMITELPETWANFMYLSII